MNAAATPGSDQTSALGSLLLWKEQLGYVSGTILAWGALLLSLWPVLCRLQTGAHVRALGRDEAVAVAATSYYLLALLVAVGLGMLVFGSAHIVARGFWLGHFLLETEGTGAEPPSDRVARRTYLILNVLWATSLVFLMLIGLSALVHSSPDS